MLAQTTGVVTKKIINFTSKPGLSLLTEAAGRIFIPAICDNQNYCE